MNDAIEFLKNNEYFLFTRIMKGVIFLYKKVGEII